MSTTEAVPYRSISIGRCFDDAIAVYKRNFLTLFLAAIVFDILTGLSLLILAGPLFGGVCLMTLRAMRDGDCRFGDLFRTFDRFLPLLGLFFLTTIAVLFGLVLLVVPGLVLMTFWLYPYYLIADRRMGVFAALGTSADMVIRGGFWRHFGLMALGLALAIGSSLFGYVAFIVGWLVTPLGWLIVTSAYLQLTDADRTPEAEAVSEPPEPPIAQDI